MPLWQELSLSLCQTARHANLTDVVDNQAVIGYHIPMSEFFLTNPEDPTFVPPTKRDTNRYWGHKESTVKELMNLGVPLRPAELAVIDFRTELYLCQRNKLTPEQTARMLLDNTKRVYTNDEGEWHCMN